MSTYEPENKSFSSDIGEQQIQIVTQLMKVAPTMYSIDELFQWLAYAIIQHFNLQLVQFWTPFLNASGVLSTHLRMMVSRDPSLPEQVILNNQVIVIAKRVAHEPRLVPSQPVEILFPAHHASLLKRYGINFCAGGFMNSNVLLPPPNNNPSSLKEPALFSLTTLLFLSQPAHRDLMPTVSTILKQAVGLATNRGLLLPTLPPSPAPLPITLPPPQQEITPPSLSSLIPRRKEGSNLMLSSNPFSRTAVIPDKQARRLHAMLDGKKSVAELCRNMGIDMKDISAALQMLLKMQRIELRDAAGQSVDITLFFPESDL